MVLITKHGIMFVSGKNVGEDFFRVAKLIVVYYNS